MCAEHGALLVIDEVITGFRLGLTGAQGRLGVHGDISIYAKAIASGFPLAVLGTTTDLLAPVGRGEVNHSGTYNTGVSSLAAGVATLRCLIDTDPYPEMERLTVRLAEGLEEAGTDAGVALAVDHVGGPLLQTRFGDGRPMRSRADFAANSDRVLLARFLELLQDLGVQADQPRALVRVERPRRCVGRPHARRRRPRRSPACRHPARRRQWLSRTMVEPLAPTRKSRSQPVSACVT